MQKARLLSYTAFRSVSSPLNECPDDGELHFLEKVHYSVHQFPLRYLVSLLEGI